MKIFLDIEIRRKLMGALVCFETGWTDLLSNERSLRNSIERSKEHSNINGSIETYKVTAN